MEGIGGFTQNAVLTRFRISCIFDLFVRFFMNELDAYESCQLCKADETVIKLGYSRNINFLVNFSTDGCVLTQNTIAFAFASTYQLEI